VFQWSFIRNRCYRVAAATLAGALTIGTASAALPYTASDVKGATLIPLAALPHSPENGSLDDFCEGYRARKMTDAGRQVAKLGWIVTSEAPLGRYRVVTFASGFTRGTSAICFPRNANIGIFDGSNLVALAYTARASDWQLGNVEPLENGALLVWEGQGVGAPIGELHEENGGFHLMKVAAERTFCRGRAIVPNVYDKGLDVARKILIAHGWQPLPADDKPGDFDVAAELVKHGVVEAETCSGTGVGYCSFHYRKSTDVLSVVTVGGDPQPANDDVVGYSVSCRGNMSSNR
jgi:hypothetical protein